LSASLHISVRVYDVGPGGDPNARALATRPGLPATVDRFRGADKRSEPQ